MSDPHDILQTTLRQVFLALRSWSVCRSSTDPWSARGDAWGADGLYGQVQFWCASLPISADPWDSKCNNAFVCIYRSNWSNALETWKLINGHIAFFDYLYLFIAFCKHIKWYKMTWVKSQRDPASSYHTLSKPFTVVDHVHYFGTETYYVIGRSWWASQWWI